MSAYRIKIGYLVFISCHSGGCSVQHSRSSLFTFLLFSCHASRAEVISTKSQMFGRLALRLYCSVLHRPQNGNILGRASIILSVAESAVYVFMRSINPILSWSTNSTFTDLDGLSAVRLIRNSSKSLRGHH